MIFVFYFFALVLILTSIRSLLGGIEYLRFFQTELAKPESAFSPFVSVIAPCRGVDQGFAENLTGLFEQDYPAYEIVFVVDDKNDPACELIEKFSRKVESNAIRVKLVIADKAKNSSQKVENLVEGVLHTSADSFGFVLVDSDARTSSNWLRCLVAPLADASAGAATGYRWFISKNSNLASELRSAWNASIASALGINTESNFCWGGSMAIRRDTFERLQIREKWAGTLSDDFTVTRLVRDAGLPIVFVPQALTATVEDCSLIEMLEFTTRQMKITRVYARKLWLLSFVGSGLFIAVMLSSFLIIILSRQNNLAVFAAYSTLLLVTVFSTAKSWMRLHAVKLILSNYAADLRRQFWSQTALWLIAPLIFFYNSLAALFSNRVKWRGTVYELKSPTETVIIAD